MNGPQHRHMLTELDIRGSAGRIASNVTEPARMSPNRYGSNLQRYRVIRIFYLSQLFPRRSPVAFVASLSCRITLMSLKFFAPPVLRVTNRIREDLRRFPAR